MMLKSGRPRAKKIKMKAFGFVAIGILLCTFLNSIYDSHVCAIAMISCRKPVKGSICLGLFLYTFKSFLHVFSSISGGVDLQKRTCIAHTKHISYSSLYPAQEKSRAIRSNLLRVVIPQIFLNS